ncbi:MAG: DHH family phosphoesterase [Anaerolineae bacterium]|nr:DHH family phosphoesterase [Anaerolineae bacterium]
MNDAVLEKARQRFEASQSVLVFSHIRPDGDAVGSLLGLGLALKNKGKQVQMILADGVPSSFNHLPGAGDIQRKAQDAFDLVVTVDSADRDRVGNALDENIQVDINIDHHVTNSRFAEVNLVESTAVATAVILAQHFDALGFALTQPIADALLTGLLTDTIGFRTQNMNSAALRIAANLMDMGSDLPQLYTRVLVNRSLEATRYWGAGLSRLQHHNGLVWTVLSLEDRKAVGYPGRDDADLVNILAAIDGAQIALIFIEQHHNKVKISWRARAGIDVSQVAAQFGGGGHFAAAGATVEGSLDEIQPMVIAATQALLENEQSLH